MRCQWVWVCVRVCVCVFVCACMCVCVMWSILRHFRSFFGRYFRRRRRRSVMGWHATMIDHSPWVDWRRNLEVKELGRSKWHRLQTNNRWWHSMLSRLIFTVLIPSSLLWESLFPSQGDPNRVVLEGRFTRQAEIAVAYLIFNKMLMCST